VCFSSERLNKWLKRSPLATMKFFFWPDENCSHENGMGLQVVGKLKRLPPCHLLSLLSPWSFAVFGRLLKSGLQTNRNDFQGLSI
jgi:hypothetical protein